MLKREGLIIGEEYVNKDGLGCVVMDVHGYQVFYRFQLNKIWYCEETTINNALEHWKPFKPKKHKVTGWVNIYDYDGKMRLGGVHSNRVLADAYDDAGRVACVKVELEFEEGQFDD